MSIKARKKSMLMGAAYSIVLNAALIWKDVLAFLNIKNIGEAPEKDFKHIFKDGA